MRTPSLQSASVCRHSCLAFLRLKYSSGADDGSQPMSKLARCALFFFLSISFVAGVAAQALSPDKSGAAAPARLDLGQKIDDAAKIREQREQDITKMIDALRADLFKLIQETKSGDEQRNAALLQQVNDLRGL